MQSDESSSVGVVIDDARLGTVIAKESKRVLLIAFAFPPQADVGAIRPAGLAKYLPQFGWIPSVITVRLDGECRSGLVVETEYRDLLDKVKEWLHLDKKRGFHELLGLPVASIPRASFLHSRLLDALKALVTYPDQQKYWIPFALRAIADVARKQQVHAIISTAPPFATHMIATRAKHLLDCPWIADYRDLWYDPLTLHETPGIAALIRRRTERKVLANADALVTVSEPWAERLRRWHPTKKVVCVSNGFDEAEYRDTPCELTNTFTITHTGQLYRGWRDPTELFEAVRELIAEGTLSRQYVRIRFYGPIDGFLPPLVSRFRLDDVVEIHDSVPRKEIFRLQCESQLLLLLTWWNPKENGVLTGKVYEYLAASRPILAIGGGRGAITELLDETRSGVHAISKPDIKKALTDAYCEYRQFQGVRYCGDRRVVGKYTHENMALQFAQLLDSVTGDHVLRLT